MVVAPSLAWKLALAFALGGVILFSAYGRAPRQPLPRADLRHLVLAALGLYAVGSVAWLTHHAAIAALVFAAGIATAALAAWLSRGVDSDDPPSAGEPADEHPPPGPEGLDWDRFEREFRTYARSRERDARGSRRDRAPAGPR